MVKMSTVLDVRTKSIEEIKRTLSSQNETLKKANQELLLKVRLEQESRQKEQDERETMLRQLKKMKMQVR